MRFWWTITKKINQNNEIIKFIRQKDEVATRQKNRKSFVEYLAKKKYHYADYLADMPIYRMTKEEVEKRKLMVKDDTKSLKEFHKIAKSANLIRKKLIEELNDVSKKLDEWHSERLKQKRELYKKLNKKVTKKKNTRKR